jgi:hypothetical protein
MSRLEPLASATALLPDAGIRAAGVFGVQDHRLAVALLGEARVAAIVGALVAPPPAPPNPASRAGREAAAVESMRPWVAIPLLVAVSGSAVHLCDWDPDKGATREVARIALPDADATVEEYRSARRVTLIERRSGYRLPLTTTVSRLSPTSAGVEDVLAALPRSRPPHPSVFQG